MASTSSCPASSRAALRDVLGNQQKDYQRLRISKFSSLFLYTQEITPQSRLQSCSGVLTPRTLDPLLQEDLRSTTFLSARLRVTVGLGSVTGVGVQQPGPSLIPAVQGSLQSLPCLPASRASRLYAPSRMLACRCRDLPKGWPPSDTT